jgi:hypothetical protein
LEIAKIVRLRVAGIGGASARPRRSVSAKILSDK